MEENPAPFEVGSLSRLSHYLQGFIHPSVVQDFLHQQYDSTRYAMRPSSAMFMKDAKREALWFTSASTRPNFFWKMKLFFTLQPRFHTQHDIPQIPKTCDALTSWESMIIYLFNTSFHPFKRSTLRPLPQIGGHSRQHRTATKRLASLHVPGLPGP